MPRCRRDDRVNRCIHGQTSHGCNSGGSIVRRRGRSHLKHKWLCISQCLLCCQAAKSDKSRPTLSTDNRGHESNISAPGVELVPFRLLKSHGAVRAMVMKLYVDEGKNQQRAFLLKNPSPRSGFGTETCRLKNPASEFGGLFGGGGPGGSSRQHDSLGSTIGIMP